MKEGKEYKWGFEKVSHIWRWWIPQTDKLKGTHSEVEGTMPGKVDKDSEELRMT